MELREKMRGRKETGRGEDGGKEREERDLEGVVLVCCRASSHPN